MVNVLLQELEKQSQQNTKALYSLAVNYAELNRNDDAIAALQKCLDLREERMIWVNVEPRFALLHSDPRFYEIVKNVGLK